MSTQPPNESSPDGEPAHTRPAVSSAGGRFKTPEEMLEGGERWQPTGYKAPILFAVGFALLVFGIISLIDHSGPTIEVAARITGKDTRDPRGGSDEYVLQGVDVDGGDFDVKVSKSNFDLTRPGDEVVITRSWLTERVIGMDAHAYRFASGRVWIDWVAIVIALAILLWSVRALRRESDGQPATNPWRRVRWWIPILLVCAIGWIVYERSRAGTSDSAPIGAAGTFAAVCASVGGEHRLR